MNVSDDSHAYRAGYCPSHGTYVGYCMACATVREERSTDNLIEQARAWNGTGSALDTAELLLDLADALEATEAERDAAQRAEKHVARAMRDVMAERDALRTALDWIEAEPEDPIKVQLWARAALDPNWDTRP